MRGTGIKPNFRHNYRVRTFALLFFFILIFVLLAARVGELQLLAPAMSGPVTPMSLEIRYPEPTRGFIYDRNGRLLVESSPAYRISIIPERYAKVKSATEELEHVIQRLIAADRPPGTSYDGTLTEEETERANALLTEVTHRYEKAIEKIKAKKLSNKEPVVILPHANRQQYVRLREHNAKENFSWLVMESNPRRNYPLGKPLAHLLGYVGPIDAETWGEAKKLPVDEPTDIPVELIGIESDASKSVDQSAKRSCEKYRYTSSIGKRGVEKLYDNDMRGCYGRSVYRVDRQGNIRGMVQEQSYPPVSGRNVHLTLDLDLQEFAYKAFAARTVDQKAGAIIVTKPSTGEILALVSYPSFDPNTFTQDYLKLVNSPNDPLVHRALTFKAPPSSTFKLVVGASALESGLFNANTKFDCQGMFRLGRDRFRCMSAAGHGSLNFYTAMQKSCNVYFYELGYRLGWDSVANTARQFGLDGIPMLDIPGEEPAIVPTKDNLPTMCERTWPGQCGKDVPYYKRPACCHWNPGDTVVASIGQGYVEFTPIQLHNIISTLAADGKLIKPYLVSHISSADQEQTIQKTDPNQRLINADHPFKASTIRALQKAAAMVTQEGGTGYWYCGAKSSVSIAGKTGTGQNSKGDDHAWFTGYAPADPEDKRERIAVTVLVENAGQGGRWAAPIAAAIFKYYYERYEDGSRKAISTPDAFDSRTPVMVTGGTPAIDANGLIKLGIFEELGLPYFPTIEEQTAQVYKRYERRLAQEYTAYLAQLQNQNFAPGSVVMTSDTIELVEDPAASELIESDPTDSSPTPPTSTKPSEAAKPAIKPSSPATKPVPTPTTSVKPEVKPDKMKDIEKVKRELERQREEAIKKLKEVKPDKPPVEATIPDQPIEGTMNTPAPAIMGPEKPEAKPTNPDGKPTEEKPKPETPKPSEPKPSEPEPKPKPVPSESSKDKEKQPDSSGNGG